MTPTRSSEKATFHFPSVDSEANERFSFWYSSDEQYLIEPDAYAIQVIWKIIDDGHIRATWSFRNGRPTVYGPRAATCFTEMPLYALQDYAARRKDGANVQFMGISILKQEAFKLGARPVIYGLTGDHKEVPRKGFEEGSPLSVWPRLLDSECDIGETEQYRYVRTQLDQTGYSDWTHEREWRWCDAHDEYRAPGFPLYTSDAPAFTTIIIFVDTIEHANRVRDRIQAKFDRKFEDDGEKLNMQNLLNTRVIALEQVPAKANLRLEEIPAVFLVPPNQPKPSEEILQKVDVAMAEASAAGAAAATNAYAEAPKTSDGHVKDVCGFAYLMTGSPQSELTAALLKREYIEHYQGEQYCFWKLSVQTPAQGLCLEEAAMEAAMKVFERHFPNAIFWTRSVLD